MIGQILHLSEFTALQLARCKQLQQSQASGQPSSRTCWTSESGLAGTQASYYGHNARPSA